MDIGLALLELFTVRCSGWINCLGFENDKLTYNHYVAPKGVRASLPLYSGHNTTASLMFPVGDAKDDFKNQLTMVVSNMANYTSGLLVVYPVTVSLLTVHSGAKLYSLFRLSCSCSFSFLPFLYFPAPPLPINLLFIIFLPSALGSVGTESPVDWTGF